MSDFDQQPETPSIPATPPTQPQPLIRAAQQSAWPMVLGIIAIVLGSLGIIGSLCGTLSPLVMTMTISQQGQTTGMEWFEQNKTWMVISQLIIAGVAVLLLAGGIGLVRRRMFGMRLCQVWAVVKILATTVNGVVGYSMQQEHFEAMQNDPNMPPFMGGGLFSAMGIVGIVLSLAWGWALPIFMLIWFALRKTKIEVATWSKDMKQEDFIAPLT